MKSKPFNKTVKFLPIVEWLPNYQKSDLPGDLSAGLTVGIMLIPQGMAYAMLVGLEPIHGLYVATVPLMLYAIFGTSRHLAVGPDAIMSLLTAAGIGALKATGTEEYLLYVVTLTLLVGMIRLAMGIFHLGFVVNFLSNPVINGFTSAAAIVIGLSQVKHLFGIELPNSSVVQEMAMAIGKNIDHIHWLTFSIGVLGMLIIIYVKKIHPLFPAPLSAVIIGILLVWVFDLNAQGVDIVGEVPGGLPAFSMPLFDLTLWGSLFPIALTIALVGFAQSYAIAKTIQAKHKSYSIDANQELIGLGMANLGAAFFNGFPVSGGFSRSAVNSGAGARTAMSSIISVFVIVLTLLFFTELFYYLPQAILASVILAAVSGLIDVKGPLHLWSKDKSDFSLLVATFLVTLGLGIEIGIVSGMVFSLLMVIYKASKPHMAQLGKVPGTQIYRNIKRFDNLEIRQDLLMARLDGPIYFANVGYIKDKLDQWLEEKKGTAHWIIFNMESVTSLDSTGAQALDDWILGWRADGMDVLLTGAKGPVRDALDRWGLIKSLGINHIFLDDQAAVEYADNKLNPKSMKKLSGYATQSNLKNK